MHLPNLIAEAPAAVPYETDAVVPCGFVGHRIGVRVISILSGSLLSRDYFGINRFFICKLVLRLISETPAAMPDETNAVVPCGDVRSRIGFQVI